MTADRDEGHGINGTKSRTSTSAGKGEMGEGNCGSGKTHRRHRLLARGFAVGATQRRMCVTWLGVVRRVCLARPSKSQ